MGSLAEYQRKRHFGATPEPSGKKGKARGGNRFVVQKHDATRLHYDFRLEIEGVLVSWAVPKGPSQNPADKRLAVMTEDHPLEYGDFEGVIPEGQYGAGPVMVWDHGTFEMLETDSKYGATATTQLARGELKFNLRGKKLRGSFVLVKLKRSEKGNEWLLIKHKDHNVDPKYDIDQHDGSVITGRTIPEIQQNLPASASALAGRPEEVPGARKAAMPREIQPMLASLASKPFSNPEWIFEIKWDGVRAVAFVKDGQVRLQSRTGRDCTSQYPELHGLAQQLDAREAVLDGEIVYLDEHGRSSFEVLQSRMNVAKPSAKVREQIPVTYYLFDLLYCDGYDLREAPLLERKKLLKRILYPGDPFRFSDHHAEHGLEIFAAAKAQGLEGILAKHAHSQYSSRRSASWLKLKVTNELSAVVGGWTAGRGSREYFGALLLGLYNDGKLQYIGNVGTGFDNKKQKEVFEQLKKLETKANPFAVEPDTREQKWYCKPEIVARVKYGEWTSEPRLRAPVFLGLQPDMKPADCRVENETPAEPPKQQSAAVVRAPEIAGKVLKGVEALEHELLKGRAESINIELHGKRLRLSNLNKTYFPESKYTKRDVLTYYYRMAERVLPYLRERPLVLRRYPNGITGESFFQKDVGETLPDWIDTAVVDSEHRGEKMKYFVANDLAALMYLTNLGCIDHNPWPSRRDHLEIPDYFFFDLDPTPDTPYDTVVEVARAIWERLQTLEVKIFPKTSGATGLHLYLPLEPVYGYEQVRSFAGVIARLVADENHKIVTLERTVAKRPQGKVLIDFLQNAFGKPLAAPYTLRAHPRAPVSAPLEPRELKRGLKPEKFNMKTIFKRLQERGDPWADFWKSRQRLERATRLLEKQLK